MHVLPPGLQALHKRPFGKLIVELGRVEVAGDYNQQPKLLRLKFFGEQQSNHLLCHEQQIVEYPVHCSLWHFHKYLCGQNLKIEVVADRNNRQVLVGEVNVFLPLLLPRTLDSNLNNLIDTPIEQSCGLFRSDESPPFGSKEIGKLKVRVHTIFDRKMCNVARPLITSLLDSASRTKKPIPKQPRQPTPSSYQVLDMMLLNKEFNPQPPSPIRLSPAKPTAMQHPELSLEDHTRLMEEDIDRMVAELESREYDSSKYQDASQQTGYKTFFKENISSTMKAPMLPYVEISEYHLTNPSKITTSSYGNSNNSTNRVGTPLLYSNPGQAIAPQPKQNFQKRPEAASFSSKSLKIDIYELSFSGMPFSEQQLLMLCTAKLRMQLPNQQQATFSGRRSGQTVSYQFKGYEVEVNERSDSNGQTKLFVGSEVVTFTVVEDYSGRELAFGTLHLQRLIRAEGRGVFVVAMNNRNIKTDGVTRPQTLAISSTELTKMRPTTACLYSLRVGLELQSHAKGKVYQLFLEISNIAQLAIQEKECRLRYKLYGTQQNIELECKVGTTLNHCSVMPVLLESIIGDKQPKLIVEVWNHTFQSLAGLVELELQQIPKVLLHSNGKLDESIITANVYPIFLYKGSQAIKQLITKKAIGSIELSLAFGSVKQINRVMAEREQKQPILVPDIIREEKKVVLPYDQKLGLFVKQKKKEVKEVDIQVDIPQETQEPSIMEHSPIKYQPDDSIASEEESMHVLNVVPSQNTRINRPMSINMPTEPKASKPLANLTREFIAQTEQFIEHVLAINPNFLPDLKQAVSRHLLFSFIERPALLECMLGATHIDEDTADKLIGLIPKTVDSSMLSITPLYDYFTSFTVSRTISEKLISEELLGDYMLERYAERVDLETERCDQYIEDRDEVKEKLRHMGYQVSLREVEVFWKRYSTHFKISDLKSWSQTIGQLKESMRKKQLRLTLNEAQTINLLNAIYQPCNESELSEPKHNCLNVTVKGLDSCVESAKCLLGLTVQQSTIKVAVLGWSIVFGEDTSKQIILPHDFSREGFAYETSTVQLCSGASVISQCSVNLQRLVLEDIDGTYAMKTSEGSFCGLIRLTLQYLE